MSYKKGWWELPNLPTRCPVCDDKRTDAEEVKVHNEIAAQRGCRSYLDARRPLTR